MENFDVVVCGCGSAGFCAAVSAAKTAAALAVKHSGGNTEELDTSLVKSTLANNGCIVPGVTEFNSFEHMMSIEYPPLSV